MRAYKLDSDVKPSEVTFSLASKDATYKILMQATTSIFIYNFMRLQLYSHEYSTSELVLNNSSFRKKRKYEYLDFYEDLDFSIYMHNVRNVDREINFTIWRFEDYERDMSDEEPVVKKFRYYISYEEPRAIGNLILLR